MIYDITNRLTLMKYTTSFFLISLILLCSCNSDHKGAASSEHPEMDETELTRVTMLIDPAPETYQEDQVNRLLQYALDHNLPVHKTESGLLYWIQKPGNDQRAQKEDKILVRYKGNLLDGTVFDQSPASGEPVEFNLSDMIPAWQEALKLIGEDGKMTILTHSDLAYRGQRIGNVIAPYSPLIFEVELIAVVR